MKTNLKSVFSAFAGVCLITATLSACATGTSRAPGQNTGQQQVRFQRSLVNATTQYTGTNVTGTPFGYGMGYGINQATTLGGNLGTNYGRTSPGTTLGMGTNYGRTSPGTTLGMGTNYGMNRVASQQTAFNTQKASNIRMQLMKMSGVANADVVVMGNTALVGYKPAANTRNTAALRNSITSKVKQIDSTITNVTVSESSDIMSRISKLSTDITSNRPVKAITDEFNSIIRGITPVTR